MDGVTVAWLIACVGTCFCGYLAGLDRGQVLSATSRAKQTRWRREQLCKAGQRHNWLTVHTQVTANNEVTHEDRCNTCGAWCQFRGWGNAWPTGPVSYPTEES